MRDRVDAAVEQSLEIVRQRIDQVGVAEPTIQRVGADRILVQLPGVQDPSRIRAAARQHGEADASTCWRRGRSGRPPAAGRHACCRRRRPRALPDRGSRRARRRPADRCPRRLRPAHAASRSSRSASTTSARGSSPTSPRQCRQALRHRARRQGAERARHPRADHRRLRPDQRQLHRRSRRRDLAALLRAGALPAPLTVIEERTVGADLGSDAIEMGIVHRPRRLRARLRLHVRALRTVGPDRQPRAAR